MISADSEPHVYGTKEAQAVAVVHSVPAKKIRRRESSGTIRVDEGSRTGLDVAEAEECHQHDRVYPNTQPRCSNNNNSNRNSSIGVHDAAKGYRHTEAPPHPEQEKVERSIEGVRLSHSDLLTLRGRVTPYRIVCPQVK